MSIRFKDKYSFEKRLQESTTTREKYPDRVPIICEKYKYEKRIKDITKVKYLVPTDLTIHQFSYVIRKKIDIGSDQALFMFINRKLLPPSVWMIELYDNYKDEDGFLYINYTLENTFGSI